VDNRYAELRQLVNSSTKDISHSPLVTLTQGFKELYLLSSAAIAAEARGVPLPQTALPTRLRTEALSLPQPARGMLEQMATQTGSLLDRMRP